MVTTYPIRFEVDFPDRQLDRLSTAFRILAAIPILVVMAVLPGESFHLGGQTAGYVASGSGLLFLPPLLMIVFRQKYPRWWFDWSLNLLRFSNRVAAYLALLDDRYPSTDEEQAIHLDIPYPDARQMNRLLPLVKWVLAIPHYVVLFFLGIGALVAVVIAWFAIILTGRYPQSLFRYVVGVLRWTNRVTAYALVLATDEYPPFRLG
ncbi:MAG TPA: DUF4389 domain-containing protein [Candidatus Dormibacteraeota bacterium]|nr:DUF4389 domain-containing protein [Candidatus Dormibacteraeota bacterium]